MAQNSISLWENGGVDLTCGQVAALEKRLGLRPGTLFIEAGYVDVRLLGAEAPALIALGRLEEAVATLQAVLTVTESPS
jgi:hypothetical protein